MQTAGRWAWLAALFLLPGHVAGQTREPPPARIESCAGCHGEGGNSQTPGVPSIAGQPKIFLENLLVLVREGMRGSEAMQGVMRGMTDKEIIAIAKHFSALPPRAVPAKTEAALVKPGRQLAVKLRCGICHLPDYRGQQQVPRLAGQREEYLVSVMLAFRDNPPRGVDTQMSAALYGVPDDDIRALAYFLARVQ
jgi:cytochrome c553